MFCVKEMMHSDTRRYTFLAGHKTILIVMIMVFFSCAEPQDTPAVMELIPPKETGVYFSNELRETPEMNIFNYMYFYNGGGVAAEDVNGDGLKDIYFTSNQDSNRLYLNRGNWKFEDVTARTKTAGRPGWCTGTVITDVNGDGRMDIYVNNLGDYLSFKGKNQLFINEGNDESGIPVFVDRAREYGLDLTGFSTQAAFFDYDLDGDLDMFQLNHSVHQNGTFGKADLRKERHPLSGDRLLRNDNNKFTDVTEQAGIYSSVIGYGLGISIADVNLDGYPDIYIGNDFHENDYLYINQGDGTFKEMLESSLMHTSRFSMGNDIADFNNDLYPDIITLDMLPENPVMLKASAAEDAYDLYDFKLNFGYNYQYSRNCLQLNQQNGSFSDIGLMAGVAATDWSWSALFLDIDLDGKKDIFITNGIKRRSNDLDYINFITTDSIQYKLKAAVVDEAELELVRTMPTVKLANYFYLNNGDSTFTQMAGDWGLDIPSFSHGAAYADFDNDGDMDLVTNNVDDHPFLYKNNTIELQSNVNYLKLALIGSEQNPKAVGAKVVLFTSNGRQLQENFPTKGFQSSVTHDMTFGIGTSQQVDSAYVIWPDKTFTVRYNIATNQTITVKKEDTDPVFDYQFFTTHQQRKKLLEKPEVHISFEHKENKFVEFNREPLMPFMVSAEGPGVAVGDINDDGSEDLFLGGAKWQSAQLFVQRNGNFVPVQDQLFRVDSLSEDVASEFFDADGDGDLDLIVVSGGNEFAQKAPAMQVRLYLNDGKGTFTKSEGYLPELYLTGATVSVSDIDGDNDPDLFIGARAVPWNYGVIPDSYLLLNDGTGHFKDVTEQLAPELRNPGHLTTAVFADMNNDGSEDFILTGDWMPISIFYNKGGYFEKADQEANGLAYSNGLWSVLNITDFDNDGDLDIIGGNLGLNSKLRASKDQPLTLYVNDFDGNGKIEQVLTHYIQGEEHIFQTKDELVKSLNSIKKDYLSYQKFAEAGLKDIFTEDQLENATKYYAYVLETSYIENLGNGQFSIKPLKKPVQFSSVQALLAEDLDHDGNEDIMVTGNYYHTNIQMGRYDASFGHILLGDGKGNFQYPTHNKSGFFVKEATIAIKKLKVGNDIYFIIVRNNNSPVFYKMKS
ncbi:VCBS repeat-containing protein [Fulvivirga sp. M361]|uniref:VCBS repeat-containing protein n=1 Tax=Fulvivirga sp. M361 TaxID=2594266 RepID=UPI0016298754|nr:VCBS repeat-containing protein [Fulvivirga sp. M361]